MPQNVESKQIQKIYQANHYQNKADVALAAQCGLVGCRLCSERLPV